jgi:hypothetical protein
MNVCRLEFQGPEQILKISGGTYHMRKRNNKQTYKKGLLISVVLLCRRTDEVQAKL